MSEKTKHQEKKAKRQEKKAKHQEEIVLSPVDVLFLGVVLFLLGVLLSNREYTDTPKKQYITETKLNKTDLANSEIIEYTISEQEKIILTGKKTKYRNLLRIFIKFLIHTMSIEEIEKHGNLNLLQTNENGKKGYHWCDDIQMSLQCKSATETLKGIVKMIKVSKFNIELSIKLKTGSIVHFKI